MVAIKIQRFLGAAPKVSPELLPDGAGQTAYNTKLFSGDLVPYPDAPVVDSTARIGEIKRLHALRNPSTSALVWLTWATDVDVVTASATTDDEQRFYYTGDGAPKVSNYELATSVGEPYPDAYYDLGLDLPEDVPTAEAAGFSQLTTSHYARDAANTAIITFATAHGLRTGNIVTISEFTGSPAEDFNVTNVRITAISTTEIEFYNAGSAISKATDTNGRVDLAGVTVQRQYTYTWYTPWSEESVAADPSSKIFLKEGEQVTVGNLPSAPPSGDNFVRGIRLYRTLTSASGTDFYLLSTLWFPRTTVSVARASNVATVVFDDQHNMIVGDRFRLKGCTDATFDVSSGEVVSVVDDNTITFASTGSDVSTTADTTGALYVDIAELAVDDIRVWGEVFTTATRARADKVITITTSENHGFSTGQRVTITSMGDTTYNVTEGQITVTGVDSFTYTNDLGVATASFARTSNVATVVTGSAHGLSTSDVVTIIGATDTSFNATGVTVTVSDSTTFTYSNTESNVGTTADTGATIIPDEGSTADTAGSVVSFDFVDDFDFLNLSALLATDEYDKPHEDMIGLVEGQNSMLFGFFDNILCVAEPTKPHAWPTAYRRTFEYDIVDIKAVGGYLLVLTTKYAYRASGSDPLTLNVARIDKEYPCLSRRSVVNMGYGVMFATHGGIALWSPSGGLALATNYIHDWSTWEDYVDPSTIVATFMKDKYYASHDNGAFIFERNDQVGGFYVTTNHTYTAAFLDEVTNVLYTVSNDVGDITTFDQDDQLLRPLGWKSKVYMLKDYVNLGAARVIADFDPSAEALAAITTYNAGVEAYNTTIWASAGQLGTVNGPVDYTSGGIRVNNFGELNSGPVHGDGGMTRVELEAPSAYPVTFKLYVDKALKFTTTISSKAIFRLPAGYKSDTFEVEVSGRARIRAIHLAETPYGLREV
jgi:hypothetical protein